MRKLQQEIDKLYKEINETLYEYLATDDREDIMDSIKEIAKLEVEFYAKCKKHQINNYD